MKKHYFFKQRKSDLLPVEKVEKKEESNQNMNYYEQNDINKDENNKTKLIVNNKNNLNKGIEKEKLSNLNNEPNNDSDKNKEKKSQNKIKIEHETMDNLFNEVEKFNAKNILKGDLAEIYDEIIEENSDFKENIFFINLNHYENLIGNCDNKVIPPSFKDFKKEELLKSQYLPSKDLYNKYDKKAKIIKDKNEF